MHFSQRVTAGAVANGHSALRNSHTAADNSRSVVVTVGPKQRVSGAELFGLLYMNDHSVMPGCPFQNGVGRDFVIQDHGAPACGLSLGADNCAQAYIAPLFQDLKENLDLAFVGQGMQEKVA